MGKKKRRGKAVRKQRAAAAAEEIAPGVTVEPKSFVLQRGTVGKYVKALVKDLRHVMEPNTATNLRPRASNSLRDFTTVAGPLGVSHLVVLTRSDLPALNLRLVRLPHGPTITFKVEEYCLARDVVSSQKRPATYQQQFLHGPLVIINNFRSTEKHEKLTQTMIQNMFPSINVNKVNLNDIKRCVIWNNDPKTGTIDFRHYAIKAVPTGVSRSMKKLVVKNKIPDLSKYADVADYFENPGQLSESDADELGDGTNEVSLSQGLSSKGCKAPQSKAALRLVELGPRLKLRLLKMEAGMDGGEVLFHSFVPAKGPEELKAMEKEAKGKAKLKARRQAEQAANVERKAREREAHKKRCLDGMNLPTAKTRTDDDEDEDHEPDIRQDPAALLEMDPVQGFKKVSKAEAREAAGIAPTRKRKFGLNVGGDGRPPKIRIFPNSHLPLPTSKVVVAKKKPKVDKASFKKKLKIGQPRKE